MKQFKKIIAMGLAAMMALSVISTGVFAEELVTDKISEYDSLKLSADLEQCQ